MRRLICWCAVLAIGLAGCAGGAEHAASSTNPDRAGFEWPTTGVRRAATPLAMSGARIEAVGCWAVFDQIRASAEGSLFFVPPVMQLESNTEARSLRKFQPRVLVARRLDADRHPLPHDPVDDRVSWRADSLTDTVRVAFATSFSRTELLFALPRTGHVRDTMLGVAWSAFDVGPIGETNAGAVTAVRVACGAP